MRRDVELLRTILVNIEGTPDATGPGQELVIEGRQPEEVSYHIKLLHQAGLIEAYPGFGGTMCVWFPGPLTWEGHEFLAAVRIDSVWKNTLAKIKEAGGALPFEVIKALALKFAAKYAAVEGLGD